MAGRMINGAAALAELVRPAGNDDRFGAHRVLPVVPELSTLLPGRGLRRGTTIAVAAGALDPTLASPASASGSAPSALSTTSATSSVARRANQSGALSAVPSTLPAVPGAPSAVPGALSAVPDRPEPPGAPGNGGTSLLLALLSAASQSGSWCAVVGVPALGVLAAAESGIALDRLVLVPNPGPDWPTVVAALIDGVDVVVTAVPGSVSATLAGRLAARARQRGSVLMPFGRWAGADVTLEVTQGRWEGLGEGRGRLRRRRLTVLARGRGAAARPREVTLWMPGTVLPPEPVPPGRAEGPSTVSGRHRLVIVPGGEAAGADGDAGGGAVSPVAVLPVRRPRRKRGRFAAVMPA